MSAAAPRTASLRSVALAGRGGASGGKKAGDLTGRLDGPPMPPPPPEPPAAEEAPRRAEGIVDYWLGLRCGRACPPLEEIDRALIGQAWPDSLIVSFADDGQEMPRISRLGRSDSEVQYTPMVTDWILTRARHADRHATMLDEAQRFPMAGESVRYRLVLLPLAARNGGGSVLCHLCRIA